LKGHLRIPDPKWSAHNMLTLSIADI